jgi:hypothetical protein
MMTLLPDRIQGIPAMRLQRKSMGCRLEPVSADGRSFETP